MPDPASPPTQATPDQLAALYLRARDTPCPACGYNRRDGATAACPECQTPLRLTDTTLALSPRTAHTLRRLAMAALIVASIKAAITARDTYLTAASWIRDDTAAFFAKPWFVYAGAITVTAQFAAWLFLAAMSARALRTPTGSGTDRPVRCLLAGFAALLIPTVLSIAYTTTWLFQR